MALHDFMTKCLEQRVLKYLTLCEIKKNVKLIFDKKYICTGAFKLQVNAFAENSRNELEGRIE